MSSRFVGVVIIVARVHEVLRFLPNCFSRVYRGRLLPAPRSTLFRALVSRRVPLTCSLFRFNVFFSRSVPVSPSRHLCSHSPLLRHLLVSLYDSVPHAASFYLLGHSPDRPLSLRPFSGSTFGTVAATSCVTLSAKNTTRKHVRPDGEHRSARADLEDVFTGYVNPRSSSR